MPKCQYCKEQGTTSEMVKEETVTRQLKKDGTPRMLNKYFHQTCYGLYLEDKKFKQEELKKLDELYLYILKVHDVLALDGRMMEKIQDLRNGTVKVGNKKIVRYKTGVPYEIMLQTYKVQASVIDNVLRSTSFETKWNEFSYIFGIVVKNINEVVAMNKRKEKHDARLAETTVKKDISVIEVKDVYRKRKAKDNLDITDFL